MTKKTSKSQTQRIETVAAQGGGQTHPPFAEVVEPIHLSTTYERAPDNSYPGGAVYARDGNPSFRGPEQMLCAMESGGAALLFSSGMSAAVAVFQALKPGDRIVAPRQMYWSLRNWLVDFCDHWGLTLDLFDAIGDGPADCCGTGNLAELLRRPTSLLWLETPANPTWDITDIRHAAALGHDAGAIVCVDSTVATPVFSQPIVLGADITMHSATKYLNGHSDVLAGMLVVAEPLQDSAFWQRVAMNRAAGGAVPGPVEAWLLARGMRTLFVRVRTAAANAMHLARHFDGHPAVASVLYPGLATHPGHQIASSQMFGGYGAMLSLRVRGGADAAIACAARLRIFKRATSLGSTESLVEHRASVEGPGTQCPDDLLRLSVGIEHADDLVADLEQALSHELHGG